MTRMRVVVTGGRNFTDGARIETDLRALLSFGLARVAQGGNGIEEQFGNDGWPSKVRSADALAWLATHALRLEAATYWVNREVDDSRTWTGADGDWPAAGPRRNVRMLEAEQPDLVLAYPDSDSRGTWHCIRAALTRDLPVALWAPWLTAAEVLAKVGGGHVVAEEPRFVISRAPVTWHEQSVRIFKWLGREPADSFGELT